MGSGCVIFRTRHGVTNAWKVDAGSGACDGKNPRYSRQSFTSRGGYLGGGMLQLYMGVVGYSENYSVVPRAKVCSRESYCGRFSHVRFSVGCEAKYACVCVSRAHASECVRVREKETVIA
jgi:hypothetical protein